PLPSHLVFLELIHAIEAVAEKLDLPPIVLEGYNPPSSPDMVSFSMMSDPGVLEVNLPPAASWEEFDRVVRIMFAAAEKSGLRGHKFQFTGRKVSTGGGAHVVFGGPSLLENPFIKRPAILASLIRFIQNHPSLSYLFTGLFVGPSSQAPRVDESAYEVPYELDLVLQSLPAHAGDAAMIDRMLRNLLMDWNGNTHRAELSVDKFHNPYAPNGRHGLVELRAFEMMPTEEMFLSLNGLLRCLIASFAEEPFENGLIDWKEQLHDRFALPYFLRTDLQYVIDYLNARGFAFDPKWYTEHLDFRFPTITTFNTGDVVWELRQAIEPWPVMGEAPMGNGTTARTVDASTDRLQLTAINLGNKSLTAAVNGLMIPLQMQPDGCAVAGIRYRLFNTDNGLQPQVKAHIPLQFTILKADTLQIVHAFNYINWKAEKGDYDGLPVNEEEARARVTQRLVAQPGLIGQKSIATQTERRVPFTLDLRRFGNCVE
ncbi:MAG: dehydrogenase, partial [Verrucomicrobiales bacterium]|nr:dehydrogenase [Verrucomicrobiales bacterium]